MKIDKIKDELDFELPDNFEFKFLERKKKFNVYKIDYSYTTKRNNQKENYKYMLSDSNDIRFEFLEAIHQFNRDYPYRAVFNVKILNVAVIGTVTK